MVWCFSAAVMGNLVFIDEVMDNIYKYIKRKFV